MTSSNLVEVTSSAHFQDLLNADLNRVSVINFWTPWAEPCKQMNEVVRGLAEKYPATLFLQVEAEQLEEISESFDIEAVPSFLILRGHTLLGRIAGANAQELTQTVAKHATVPSYTPQSQTDAQPAKPSPGAHTEAAKETTEELNDRLRRLMNQDKVVLFMKGSPDTPRCGFSRKISALLKEQGVQFAHFDILTDEDVRQGLKVLNDWPTFPQLIVKGELVGGLDIVQEMVDSGEFKDLLA